jgi:PAS domain S-box-containing protein
MNSDDPSFPPVQDRPHAGAGQFGWFFQLLALIAIALSSTYSYPVFHSLAEGFSVIISLGVFAIAWNTRRYMKEDYLLTLGIIALCCGILDSFHLLSYKGVTLFSGYDSNLPTSLWIASRFLQGTMLAFVTWRLPNQGEAVRPLAPVPLLFGCLGISACLIGSIFAGYFPTCYVEGSGLTPFKKMSEVVIALSFALSGVLLWRRRSCFESGIARILLASVAASLAAEISFIFYLDVFDLSNLAGHLFKIVSQYLIYRAIILRGLQYPLDLLFRQLHTKQEELEHLNDSLAQTVRERTALLEQDIEQRKLVEADLAQQTALLTGLLNSIPDMVFFKDSDGTYLGCNAEFCRFVGRSREEIVGRNDLDLFPGDLAQEFRTNDRIMRELGEPRHNEERVRYPDGREVLLDTFKAPLRTLDGKIAGILGVARDNTVVKAHEVEIERLKDLYAALSQINQAIIRLRTREELFREIPRILVEFGRFNMVWIGWLSPGSSEIMVASQFGDDSGYLRGVRIVADDVPAGCGPTGTAIREGKTYVCNDYFSDPGTAPWRVAAAQAGWHSSAAFPLHLAGKPRAALTVYAQETGFFGLREVALLEEAALDLSFALDNIERETAQRQGEEELRKLSLAVAQSPISIMITDADGVIEFVNQNFLALTGYRMEEVLGRKPGMMKSGQVSPEVYRDLWGSIVAGRIWRGELLNRKKDGTLFREHCTISPIKNADGVTTNFLATKEDVTGQYLLKEQLLQSQKMEAIGRLAGGVAHDFNNILTVIMGYGGILECRSYLERSDREAVAQINAAAEKAVQLTRGLLAFSRKQVLNPKPADLNDIVRHVQKFLMRIIGEDVTYKSVCWPEALHVKADSGQIEQVLMNLATNARDAMPGGGMLTVETRMEDLTESFVVNQGGNRGGSYACISVTDTGTGIDEVTGTKIFEPFFTTKESGKGTGLGMSIVHGIVSQHDGFIYFLSRMGVGTSFHVCLPIIEEAILAGDLPILAVPSARGTETVLIAEDDASVRRITESILADHGYRVILAEDGEVAVRKFAEHRAEIRLILMDMIMPNKSGFDAYREIRGYDPAVKVLFISGYTADYIESRGQLGASEELIIKPIKPAELLRAVREMLDR